MHHLWSIIAAWAVALPLAEAMAVKEPVVNLGYTTYQGTSQPGGITEFLGMRYADPPVGANRFKRPVHPSNTNGVVLADQHGPICYGVRGLAFPGVPGIPESEDCLFVNVFTPSEALHAKKKLPVMLWIQGGAFVQLFNPNYNGTGLIEASNRGVVVITFNYRVGPYGFLASKELEDEGNLNIGLHDQRMAIAWVQKHIAKFGGDPNKITLFGTSVGAGSILLHSLEQKCTRNEDAVDWHAGIASAPYVPSVYKVSELQHQYDQFLNDTGCRDLNCLRALSSESVQLANVGKPQLEAQAGVPLFPYSPAIDGTLLPATPLEMLKRRQFSTRRKLIIGTSDSEGTLFVSQTANTTAEISQFLKLQFPLITDDDLAQAQALYANVPQTFPGVAAKLSPLFFRFAKMYGDAAYSGPAMQFAAAISEANGEVFFFRDNILDPVEVAAGYIVPHTWETQAVFGPAFATQYAALPGADSYGEGGVNHEIVKAVQSYWTRFAINGNPNSAGLVPWKSYNGSGRRLRLETNQTRTEAASSLERKRSAFWYGIAERTRV